MAGWSIRRKLGVLVTIPLVVLLVGGGVLVASLGLHYKQAHTARIYADAIPPALTTVQALDNELKAAGTDQAGLASAQAATDAQITTLKPLLKQVATNSPNAPTLADDATQTLASLNTLPATRSLVSGMSAAAITTAKSGQFGQNLQALSGKVNELLARLTSELATISPNQETTDGATLVSSMSRAAQAASDERAALTDVLNKSAPMNTKQLTLLNRAAATQDQALVAANTSANQQQQVDLQSLDNQSGELAKWRDSESQLLTTAGKQVGSADSWDQFAGQRLSQMVSIVNSAAASTQTGARSAETAALFRVGAVAGAVLLTLLVVTALLAAIARTVTGPLRRLRAGAVEVASVQLPAAVARIEQDGVSADVSLPPVLPTDAAAGPETLEVARAVDDLGAEAVRLATAQVRLRRALDEAFVSMSRRSQSMVEKQLAIIDELESQEQDPDQLRNLFRLDHLAARMRRYNDNLLVLAGSAVRTRATAPVKVAELFRAATSEMEQYERVRLQPVSGASIGGTVAGELVHLLAELLDNAAMYSPPSSPIVLSAAFTADGGLQIEVLDAGVGISPGELDRLNARLTQPEAIDTQVPSRMGLFVVARLARRGTFGVMLQSRADASGTVALVRIPATLVIGAPGSTGEIPAVSSFVSRPMTPARGFNGESVDATQYSAFSGPSLAGPPSQAAVAAGAAAEAAAGVRSATGEGLEGGQSALPRRRRTPATTGPNAGLPAEALAAAANPASGLFTPTTPPSEDDSNRQRPTGAAAIVRTPGGPAETSPTGIGGLRSLHNPDTGRAESPLTDPRFAERPGEGHHFDTPPAGFSGLPGLNRAGGSGRGGASPGEPSYQDPLTARTGEFRAEPNRNVSAAGQNGAGWGGEDLPTELAARAAAAAAYRPADPNAPMIGEDARPGFDDPTPIFDQISVWFTADPTGGIPTISADVGGDQVIDLREQEEQRPSSRWASLGDQRWLATNARAAAAPDTEGTTETGLPMRRPGANLLPSAATAAPPPVAGRPAPSEQPGGGGEQPTPDADLVRGRLGSYQRGLADARKARSQPAPAPAFDPVGASLFTANSEAGDDVGQHSGEQGGDQ